MTISNTIRTAGPYIGNDVTTAFPFYFKIFKTSDLLAVQTDVATGVATSLVLNSGYTVTLNPDQNDNPGGTVTLPAVLATGKTLVLTSSLDYLQPLDITNGGGFYPSVLNAALDRLTIFCQQLFSLASRSLKLPLSDTGVNTELPSAAARANKVLAFNDAGLPIVVIPTSGSAADLAITLASLSGASLIGNGGETVAQSFDALQIPDYATLRASTTPRKNVYITGIIPASNYFAGIAGNFIRDDFDTTSSDNGGTIIVRADGKRYKRAFAGPVNASWFDAKGNGIANDTVPIQSAFNYAISSNKSISIIAGTYIVSGLDYNSTSSHASIVGDGSGVTIIRNTLNTSPTLTIRGSPNQLNVRGINFSGNGSVRSWGSGNGAAGNSLTGTIPTSECAVRMINLVHANFDDCYFTDAIWGADIQGGIVVTFTSCYAYWNSSVGFRAWKSGASGWPNIITLRDSHAVENGEVGVYFDDGRMLILDGCDLEGNGKNTTVATNIACGVYVGDNAGSEGGTTTGPNGSAFNTLAASITNCWFEQNGNNNGAGLPNSGNMAHIVHSHGGLKLQNSLFTNATAGRHVRIRGGMYKIDDCSFESALTDPANTIDEGGFTGIGAVMYGNYINGCYTNSTTGDARLTKALCRIDPAKTTLDYSEYRTQIGQVATVAGNAAVTFPIPFLAGSSPNVTAQCLVNDSGTNMYSAEVYGVTASGFSIRTKKVASGGAVTLLAVTAMWTAVGEK